MLLSFDGTKTSQVSKYIHPHNHKGVAEGSDNPFSAYCEDRAGSDSDRSNSSLSNMANQKLFDFIATIACTHDLEDVETDLFELLDEDIKVHVIYIDHMNCHTDQPSADFFRNIHPSQRCLPYEQAMKEELRILGVVVEDNYPFQQLHYWCPLCGHKPDNAAAT